MNHLPVFPLFRPFNIDDIDWYNIFYLENKLNPYADVHYANLLTWLNINSDLNISKLDDNTIIFRYNNPLNSNETNFLPLSKELTNETLKRIFQHIDSSGISASIQEVPSIICNKLDRMIWTINDYRDGFEYIYNVEEQMKLEGPNFSNQRRVKSHFERVHANNKIDINLTNCTEENAKNIIQDFVASNRSNHNVIAAEDNIYESKVIKKGLDIAGFLQKKLFTIAIDDEIVAIVIISPLDDETISLSHIKVNYSIRDIFNYSFYQLAKLLQNTNVKEINFEQDLGITGMRFHKEILRPSRMLKKTTISRT